MVPEEKRDLPAEQTRAILEAAAPRAAQEIVDIAKIIGKMPRNVKAKLEANKMIVDRCLGTVAPKTQAVQVNVIIPAGVAVGLSKKYQIPSDDELDEDGNVIE